MAGRKRESDRRGYHEASKRTSLGRRADPKTDRQDQECRHDEYRKLSSKPGIGIAKPTGLNIIDDVRVSKTSNHYIAEHFIRPRVLRADRFAYSLADFPFQKVRFRVLKRNIEEQVMAGTGG
jgi:hypothetical protein